MTAYLAQKDLSIRAAIIHRNDDPDEDFYPMITYGKTTQIGVSFRIESKSYVSYHARSDSSYPSYALDAFGHENNISPSRIYGVALPKRLSNLKPFPI